MAVPPNMGGDRVFLGNPDNSGLSTAVGDQAAAMLQLIHALGGIIPDGQRALVDRIAAQTRITLAASDASQAREKATRELQPVTRVPLVAYGDVNHIANIRMNNVPAFSGNGQDTLDIVRWISRIFVLAQAQALTFAATINLMIQGSTGGACDYIEQMREEGKTLSQIVQQLEMRYGDLCTPEEARVKCNNMTRKDKEGLPEFIDRLRTMSRMACRLELDEAARRTAIDILVEGNIRRVLPTSVRNALEERVINRSRMGLPAFTAREIEKECLDLERRRSERKLEGALPSAKKHGIRHVKEEDSSMSESDSSSDDSSQGEDESTHLLVNEIKHQERKYIARGRPIDGKRVFKRAIKNFNQRFPRFQKKQGYQGRDYQGKDHQGARQAMAGPAQPPNPGPPNKLGDNPRKRIFELLEMANCSRGQCIQCGADGHYMNQDVCALRDKPLVDRPCTKCGKGLHQADDCLQVYQQRYAANPQKGAANIVKEESLNDQ